MSALTNLSAFITKLPLELQPEFMQLVDAVSDERDGLQNERIATSQANTGTFEVVAIAGTAETLLSNPHQTIEGC
jgi:DNA/RNA endonuclease YhcR with UshA esterase domain